jgi:hypothetical protein
MQDSLKGTTYFKIETRGLLIVTFTGSVDRDVARDVGYIENKSPDTDMSIDSPLKMPNLLA